MVFKLWTIRIFALLLLSFSSSIVAQESADAEAHFKRGEAYLQSKQYTEAIRAFKQAIRIKPEWAEAHFKLGVAYSAIPVTDSSFDEGTCQREGRDYLQFCSLSKDATEQALAADSPR